MDDLFVSTELTIPARELSWRAVRSSGPGGQNVNKVASKVELRFDPAGSSVLDPGVAQRLRQAQRHRLDAQGRLLIVCDEARTQSANLALARRRLARILGAALVVPTRRVPTRPSRAARARRMDAKRRRAERKAGRRRVGASE